VTLVSRAIARAKSSDLFHRQTSPRTTWEMIGWWESRRPWFNLIVGIAGAITCIVCAVVAVAASTLYNSEFGWPDPPLFAFIGVGIYAVMANICFTGGWVVELFIRTLWPSEADRYATTSFVLGLAFSVLLTLTPGILVGSAGVFELIAHLVRPHAG
jgi:hypothetical protein